MSEFMDERAAELIAELEAKIAALDSELNILDAERSKNLARARELARLRNAAVDVLAKARRAGELGEEVASVLRYLTPRK